MDKHARFYLEHARDSAKKNALRSLVDMEQAIACIRRDLESDLNPSYMSTFQHVPNTVELIGKWSAYTEALLVADTLTSPEVTP